MKLSLIVPCYNEKDNLKKLHEIISKELINIDYEILFINDGSFDGSNEKIQELFIEDPNHVKGINFSRNFGKEAAIYAGIINATGEYTCIIDADLQQHPKYVLEMYNFLEKNKEIDQVAMYAKNRDNKSIRNKLSSCFYKIIDKLSDVKFISNASDFRMFRTNVKDAIKQLSEVNRFSKGIFSWIGFNTEYLPYTVNKRENGKSKFSFQSLFKYAIEGFIGFSVKPLRLITYIGLLSSLSSFIYLLIIVIKKIFFVVDVSGYSSIMASILFFSGVQILSIGILGEYLSKTYLESKKRPIYLEKNKIGFKKDSIL